MCYSQHRSLIFFFFFLFFLLDFLFSSFFFFSLFFNSFPRIGYRQIPLLGDALAPEIKLSTLRGNRMVNRLLARSTRFQSFFSYIYFFFSIFFLFFFFSVFTVFFSSHIYIYIYTFFFTLNNILSLDWSQ